MYYKIVLSCDVVMLTQYYQKVFYNKIVQHMVIRLHPNFTSGKFSPGCKCKVAIVVTRFYVEPIELARYAERKTI